METGTRKKNQLIVFGSAEIARLARFYFENDSSYSVSAFVVDDAYVDADSLDGLPLLGFSQALERFPPQEYEMHVAISYRGFNRLRSEKYDQAKEVGYRLASYICTKSALWPDLDVGDNCFILENQTIQPTVHIGNNVVIWSGNHIGHGSIIGDHTYIASHVVICGHCNIGKRCFLGVNSTIRDFCSIGDDCFISMDASVTANLPPESVAIGHGAEILKPDDRRGRALVKRFFGQV